MQLNYCQKCNRFFFPYYGTSCSRCGADMGWVVSGNQCIAEGPDLDALLDLWGWFGDIPLMEGEDGNGTDDIDEDFCIWPEGTNRFDIWHWFDDQYPGGVVKLIEDYENFEARKRKKAECDSKRSVQVGIG